MVLKSFLHRTKNSIFVNYLSSFSYCFTFKFCFFLTIQSALENYFSLVIIEGAPKPEKTIGRMSFGSFNASVEVILFHCQL